MNQNKIENYEEKIRNKKCRRALKKEGISTKQQRYNWVKHLKNTHNTFYREDVPESTKNYSRDANRFMCSNAVKENCKRYCNKYTIP